MEDLPRALVAAVSHFHVYAAYPLKLRLGSCWAVHTRDYRINNPTDCQILITVPEILATLLLSPALARVWTPRIKWYVSRFHGYESTLKSCRVIMDEIHSIGQQDNGAVWEQIILLAPCPIM